MLNCFCQVPLVMFPRYLRFSILIGYMRILRTENFYSKVFTCTLVILFFTINNLLAFGGFETADTTAISLKTDAVTYLDQIKELPQSPYWPNVKPKAFVENLKIDVETPLKMYEGSNTNFCSYAALSYLPLHDDPLGFCKMMMELYTHGRAVCGKVTLDPSTAVKNVAGTLKFKGVLDVHPANQLWFLSLADHFKGYLNIFNRHFDPEDEDKFWAACNYAKFNRMIRKLFNYKVDARGSDLIGPNVKNIYEYLNERLKTGTVILYLNNARLHQKKHSMRRPAIPTHFLVLVGMEKSADIIKITYWDYGGLSLREVSPKFLDKIIFGISHCTKKVYEP